MPVSLFNLATIRQSFVRAHQANKQLQDKSYAPLSYEQKAKLDHLWKGVHVDYRWFAHFNSFREEGAEWSPSYIPDTIQYGIIDLFYSNYIKCRSIEDKNINNALFSNVEQPETLLRYVSDCKNRQGVLIDNNYRIVSHEDAIRLISGRDLLIKPSIESGGGRRIRFFSSTSNGEEVLAEIMKNKDVIVQRVASQHDRLSCFSPSSLNTLRLITFIFDDEVHVLSSVFRMGTGGLRTDNASSGGIFCGINPDGKLKPTGFTLKKYERFLTHPDSNIVFGGYIIPFFPECKKLVSELAPCFYGFSRLISWDLSITEGGTPMLIEANMTYGGCDIPQIANGPLFGELTEQVLGDVFAVKQNRILSRLL